MQTNREVLLTVKEAEERLNRKAVTIRKWVAQRRLTVVRLNRSILIPEREIDRIITESTIPARQ
jgi:excisionase family DNA binding protein